MTRYGLLSIAVGLGVTLLPFETSAHSCNKGVKRAHCFCTVTFGGGELARVVNHGQCYNQQTNIHPGSNCANYCRGEWSSSLETATRNSLIAKGLCGSRTVTRKYAAGTNPYLPLGLAKLTAC